MAAMAYACQELLALLDTLGIPFRLREHAAVMTVADSQALRGELEGPPCKCLFLKSGDGRFWLTALQAQRRADLKDMAKKLRCPRFSFASAEELQEHLGLRPGAVSVLGVVNDARGLVQVVLEETLLDSGQPLHFHPLVNTATLSISTGDLLRFLHHTGHTPRMLSSIEP